MSKNIIAGPYVWVTLTLKAASIHNWTSKFTNKTCLQKKNHLRGFYSSRLIYSLFKPLSYWNNEVLKYSEVVVKVDLNHTIF